MFDGGVVPEPLVLVDQGHDFVAAPRPAGPSVSQNLRGRTGLHPPAQRTANSEGGAVSSSDDLSPGQEPCVTNVTKATMLASWDFCSQDVFAVQNLYWPAIALGPAVLFGSIAILKWANSFPPPSPALLPHFPIFAPAFRDVPTSRARKARNSYLHNVAGYDVPMASPTPAGIATPQTTPIGARGQSDPDHVRRAGNPSSEIRSRTVKKGPCQRGRGRRLSVGWIRVPTQSMSESGS